MRNYDAIQVMNPPILRFFKLDQTIPQIQTTSSLNLPPLSEGPLYKV